MDSENEKPSRSSEVDTGITCVSQKQESIFQIFGGGKRTFEQFAPIKGFKDIIEPAKKYYII